jgi:HlyD family secretion protein
MALPLRGLNEVSNVSEVSAQRTGRRSLADLVAAEARRQTHRRTVWAFLGAAGIAGLFALFMTLRPRPVALADRFRAERASVGDVIREVRATGHVEAVTTVQVGAETSGRIATVLVDYNDNVKAGQVMARFDRESLLAQQAQALASLAAARSSLEQAKTDRAHTAADFARVDRLHKDGALSDSDFDNSEAAARLAVQRVSAADANVAAQEAAYNVAHTNLDHSIIIAPIDGIVITRNIDPGQTVASVFQTPVLFTVAADLRKMRVIAAIDEADIGEVAVRQRATFTVNAYPDRTFEGIVTDVRNSPVVVQDVVTYGAVIEVDNLDLALKPGMTASARVRTASALATLRVPAAAIRFTPPGETHANNAGVWLVDGDALRHVEVTAGITDGEVTAIAPGAVESGQALLVDLTPVGKKFYGLVH